MTPIASTDTFVLDLGNLLRLIGCKLKEPETAADNDDCNALLREAFAKFDEHQKATGVDDEYWERLREMLGRWKGGEDIDAAESDELANWVIDLKNSGTLPPDLIPAAVLAKTWSRIG